MIKNLNKGEKGYLLIEVLISIILLGMLVTGFLSAVMGSTNALVTADKLATAKNLAETQMEFVKKQQFASSYTSAPIPPEYPGYSVVITTQLMRDHNIEKVTILVKFNNADVFTLEDYKTK